MNEQSYKNGFIFDCSLVPVRISLHIKSHLAFFIFDIFFFSVSNFSKNVSQSFKIRLYNYKLHISHVRIVVCIYDDDAGVQSGRSVKKMKYIEMCNVVPCRFLALVRTKCSVEIWREKKNILGEIWVALEHRMKKITEPENKKIKYSAFAQGQSWQMMLN